MIVHKVATKRVQRKKKFGKIHNIRIFMYKSVLSSFSFFYVFFFSFRKEHVLLIFMGSLDNTDNMMQCAP